MEAATSGIEVGCENGSTFKACPERSGGSFLLFVTGPSKLRMREARTLNYCCLFESPWIQDFTHGNKAYAGNDSRNVIAK
jgi:hypothetical protein